MKDLVVSLGAVVSAFVASLCCIAPLVLAGLGLGGAGLATAVAPYRPYFLGLAGALLAVAFYFVYRPRRAACDPGEACAARRPGRTTRLALWLVAAGVLALGGFPYLLGQAGQRGAKGAESSAPVDLRRVTLEVKGMTCVGCEGAVERALLGVPGVRKARASFEQGRAEVLTAGPDGREGDLVNALKEIGYQAHATETSRGHSDG